MKKHLKEMQQYAEDYQYVDNPWELWEAALDGDIFRPLVNHPPWSNCSKYRRKNLSGKQISEGFLPWDGGGENPCKGCEVEYIMKSGEIQTRDNSDSLRWRYSGVASDIIGYKIINDHYARFKQVLKDGGEVAKLNWLEYRTIPTDHTFSGDPSNYKIVQKEPLTKADFYPGRYIKKKGSEGWSEVKKADNQHVSTDSYFVAYTYLMEQYEIWNPGSKTWEPCSKTKFV